jgi:Family of unknown function (DUF6174)
MTNIPARRSRQRVPRARFAAAGLLALLLSSCSITEPGRGGDVIELARNRQKWASAGLHDYEFDYQLSCFCAPDVTEQVHVVVRSDQLSSVSRNRDGLPALRQYGGWPTVPALFDDVQRLIDQKSDRLEVTYDPTYGYPRSIVVDVYLQAADDESSQTASNLRPLH